MPARGDPDVPLEVVVDGLLEILEPVVDAPEVEGEVLAHVTDDNLEVGEAVEDAVGDEAHEVEVDAVGEGERGPDEVLALGVQLVVDDVGGGGETNVHWDIEVGDDLPEGVKLGLIVNLYVSPLGPACCKSQSRAPWNPRS